jgi:hypothetical protein
VIINHSYAFARKAKRIFIARVNELLSFRLYDFLHNNKYNHAGKMPDWKDLTDEEKYHALLQREHIEEPPDADYNAARRLEEDAGITYRQTRIIGDYNNVEPDQFDAIVGHLGKIENVQRITNLQDKVGLTAQEITSIMNGSAFEVNESVQALAGHKAIEDFTTLDEELGLGRKFIASVLRGAGKDTAKAVDALLDESTQRNLEDVMEETNVKQDFLMAVLKDSAADIAEDVQALADRKLKIRELLQQPSVNPKTLSKQIVDAKEQGQGLSEAIDTLHAELKPSFQERVIEGESSDKQR